MEELNFILSNNTQEVFYLILAIIIWALTVIYLFRRLRRIKYGRRFGDRKIETKKHDEVLLEQKASESGE